MASNEWLVRKLHEQDKKIEALSRGGTGVGHSSIAPGENLTVISDNGEVALGAGGVEHVDGPTPATPSAPTLKLGFGTIETTWDGTFAEGEDEDGVPLTAPVDFDVVEVHCSTDPEEEEWGEDTMRGQIKTREGGTVTVGGFDVDDEVFVCLIALAKTGKRSAPSATASLIIEGLDFSHLFNEIDAANATIKNAGEVLVTEQGTLDEKLTQVDGTLNDLGQDLQAVEDAQAQLDTDLTDVMTSVDGKNTITWNPSAPSAVSTPGKAVGDLWYRTSGNSIVGFWKWSGTDWVTQLLDKTTIPLIDIGTGTFGQMSGSRIDAASITSDKVLVGSGGNVLSWGAVTQGASTTPHAAYGGATATLLPADTSKSLPAHVKVSRAASGGMSSAFAFWAGQGVKLPVDTGAEYVFSVTAYSDVGSSAELAIFWFTHGGSSLSPSAPGTAVSPTTVLTGTPTRLSVRGTVPAGALYCVPFLRLPGTASAGISLPDLRSSVGSTLIQNGAVSTQKLSADVLEVRNLKATSGQLDEAVINKLFSDVVVAKTAVANAFIGENAILTGAVTAPKITASEELWAKIAQFVKIRAEHIEADAIDGMVITGPNIRTAASGARVQMDPNGVRVFNADDDVCTHLSPDGSTFKGEFEAETLVVNEGAEFKANNTLAQGSSLTLAAGVTDPTAPPVVQPFWGGVEFTPPALLNGQLVGLAFDGTNYWTTAGTWYEVSQPSNQVFRINSTTGTVAGFTFPESGTTERFGVTCIGSELFWYYRTGYTHKVVVTDLSVVKLREFTIPAADAGHSASNPLTFKPGIGNDGTNVVVGHCSDDGTLRVRTYNKTTGVQVGSTASEGNSNFASDITGIYVGAADGSTTRIWVNQERTGIVYAYTTAGVYVSGEQFPVAEANSTGLVFSGGKFHTLDPTGVVHEYADKDTGDGSSDWWAAYRWYTDVDNDDLIEPTDYTSRVSPGARFTWPKRAMIRVQGQPLPAGVGAVGPFLAKKTTVPIRTDYHAATWWAITGTSRAEYRSLPTNWATKPVPTDSNNFPNAEKAVVQSASSTFRVEGDGSGRWGPLTFNADGTLSGIPKMAAGKGETVTVTSGGFNTKTVSFPAGRFTNPPAVTVSADTTSAELVNVNPLTITKDGFTLSVRRTNSTPTTVDWIAMEVN